MIVTLTEGDDGKTVQLTAGETFVLRLHEHAAAGYRWAFDGLDGALIEAHESEFRPDSSAVGAGGDTQWTLTAKAPGVTVLKLKLWRHWEGERSVQKRFAVTLRIRS